MSAARGAACAGRGEEVFLLAAGSLEDEERARLKAHLDTGCSRCREDLARAESQLAGLAFSLEPVEPPDSVRRRLLARVAEDRGRSPVPAPRRARTRPSWAAAAAIGVLFGIGLGAYYMERRVVEPLLEAPPSQAERAAQAEWIERVAQLEGEVAELEEMLGEQDDELSDLEAHLTLAREQLRMFRGDALVRVALQGSDLWADAHARMFWEWTDEYTCYLHVRESPAPPAGRAQVLWLEDEEGHFIRVGVLVRDPEGGATVFAKLPQEERRVVRALVSDEPDEPEALGDAPRGPVLLSAEL